MLETRTIGLPSDSTPWRLPMQSTFRRESRTWTSPLSHLIASKGDRMVSDVLTPMLLADY